MKIISIPGIQKREFIRENVTLSKTQEGIKERSKIQVDLTKKTFIPETQHKFLPQFLTSYFLTLFLSDPVSKLFDFLYSQFMATGEHGECGVSALPRVARENESACVIVKTQHPNMEAKDVPDLFVKRCHVVYQTAQVTPFLT